jgi:hypothetical protein
MDKLHAKLGELRDINRRNQVIPEHRVALARILRDHPPIERVRLTDSRFANVARGKLKQEYKGTVGKDLDSLLANIQSDLMLVAKQLDETMDAFREAMPLAEQGTFAGMVLSGRAPLPEKVMQSADLIMVLTQFYNRACQTTIAADMMVYPKGLEWLKKPSKDWRADARAAE